jgi:hypothetical protein
MRSLKGIIRVNERRRRKKARQLPANSISSLSGAISREILNKALNITEVKPQVGKEIMCHQTNELFSSSKAKITRSERTGGTEKRTKQGTRKFIQKAPGTD